MLSFECDYNNGAAPKVLENIIKTNDLRLAGYGDDDLTKEAERKIRKAIGMESDCEFVTGGTEANSLVISTLLHQYEGVVAAATGHVSIHEAGAIEYSGHKVINTEGKDGKVVPSSLRALLSSYYADGNKDAIVKPGMLYISEPTELGTLYDKSELRELRAICDEYSLLLYIDGARLAYALASPYSDITLKDIASLSDVFYIGGTKCGALFGEAICFKPGLRPKHFNMLKKQRGSLMAKGRTLGAEFSALFTENYYLELGLHAARMTERLKAILKEKGYTFYFDSPTNQQFVVVTNDKMKALSESVRFGYWEKVDEEHTAIRFCTSWSTTDEELDELREIL